MKWNDTMQTSSASSADTELREKRMDGTVRLLGRMLGSGTYMDITYSSTNPLVLRIAGINGSMVTSVVLHLPQS